MSNAVHIFLYLKIYILSQDFNNLSQLISEAIMTVSCFLPQFPNALLAERMKYCQILPAFLVSRSRNTHDRDILLVIVTISGMILECHRIVLTSVFVYQIPILSSTGCFIYKCNI